MDSPLTGVETSPALRVALASKERPALLDTLAPVLATALDAVVVLRPDGTVADWNAGAAAIFGWSREEAVGADLAELIVPPELRHAHNAGMSHYEKTGEGPVLRRLVEVPALHRSGARLPVELLVTPVEDGDTRFFLGFLRDITQRRKAEQTLQRQARVSALMFELAALAGATDSFDEAVATALRAICDLSGWPAGHALVVAEGGRELTPSMIWHPAEPDSFAALKASTRSMRFAMGEGLPGRILERGEPVWIGRARADPDFLRNRPAAADIGVEAAFGFPIKSGEAVIVVLEFFSAEPVEPDAELLMTVGTVGEQIGRVFERKLLEDKLRAEKTALEAEIAERRRMERHQALLLAELNHRVKNTLTVVMGIASQTARSSETMRAFTDDFLGRLSALARTHSLLTERHWGATPLAELAANVLSPHLAAPDPRLTLQGPTVLLEQKVRPVHEHDPARVGHQCRQARRARDAGRVARADLDRGPRTTD
jgi:PAS domain S-box-containing protein